MAPYVFFRVELGFGFLFRSGLCLGLLGKSEGAESWPNITIECGTNKMELKIFNPLGTRPTYLTLEGSSSSPLKLQVTGEVTLSPTILNKCGGGETPAPKKENKSPAVKPKKKKKKPKGVRAYENRTKLRAKQPQQQWVATTAQGEGREKHEEISPTSSEDDKLSADREATRHEGNLLSKEVPSTPT